MILSILAMIVAAAFAVDLTMLTAPDWVRWRLTHAAIVAFLGSVAFSALYQVDETNRIYGAMILDHQRTIEWLKFKKETSKPGVAQR